MRLLISILSISLFLSVTISCQNEKVVAKNPNIILLIGDGMGLSQLSAAYYYGDTEPNFSRFTEIGLINTSPAKKKITDSGAAGTALACGEKTYNGFIGMDTDTIAIENLVEVLSAKGYNTGILATSSITHATPASFYSHVKTRSLQFDIAEQLVESEVDFFAGGGSKYFSEREDGRDLIKELEANGFAINQSGEPLENSTSKLGYILATDGMPSKINNRGDFLPEYTQMAIDFISKKEESFFIMIEGSQIDWAAHDNKTDYLIAELLDFDKTVGVACDFADKQGNTLVIVLADHETGGFSLAKKDSKYADINPEFSTTGHSATLIPVFAYGPSSELFKGLYQNNEIFHKILTACNSHELEVSVDETELSKGINKLY